MAYKATFRVKNEEPIEIACSGNMLQTSLNFETVDHDIFQCTIIHIFYFLNLSNVYRRNVSESFYLVFQPQKLAKVPKCIFHSMDSTLA